MFTQNDVNNASSNVVINYSENGVSQSVIPEEGFEYGFTLFARDFFEVINTVISESGNGTSQEAGSNLIDSRFDIDLIYEEQFTSPSLPPLTLPAIQLIGEADSDGFDADSRSFISINSFTPVLDSESFLVFSDTLDGDNSNFQNLPTRGDRLRDIVTRRIDGRDIWDATYENDDPGLKRIGAVGVQTSSISTQSTGSAMSYARFELGAPIPIPGAVWLLGSALFVFVVVYQKRSS